MSSCRCPPPATPSSPPLIKRILRRRKPVVTVVNHGHVSAFPLRPGIPCTSSLNPQHTRASRNSPARYFLAAPHHAVVTQIPLLVAFVVGVDTASPLLSATVVLQAPFLYAAASPLLRAAGVPQIPFLDAALIPSSTRGDSAGIEALLPRSGFRVDAKRGCSAAGIEALLPSRGFFVDASGTAGIETILPSTGFLLDASSATDPTGIGAPCDSTIVDLFTITTSSLFAGSAGTASLPRRVFSRSVSTTPGPYQDFAATALLASPHRRNSAAPVATSRLLLRDLPIKGGGC